MTRPDRAPIALHDEPVGDLPTMRWAASGPADGRLVLLVHGWPECWVSWRGVLHALGAAGFRAVAPDMRGYGGTSAPHEVERYTMLDLVGDLVALLRHLGRTQALIVGHDWGAVVAWHAALLRPDLFGAVVGMSVPYAPPAATHVLAALQARGIRDSYMQYFQPEGVAEAELGADTAASLRRIHFSGSGEAAAWRQTGHERASRTAMFGRVPTADGMLAATVDPVAEGLPLPAWMTAEDAAVYLEGFRRNGWRGPLNWYRNFERNVQLLAPWRGEPIRQPSMFMAGAADGVLRFPGNQALLDRYPQTLPGLQGLHLLPGAGHWVQRERAAEVSRLLIAFAQAR